MTALLLLLALLPQDEPARLVEKLASERVDERDDAERKLLEKGEAAVPALEKAAKDRDAEVAGRAARLLRIVFSRRLLSPRLRAAMPGIETRMSVEDERGWMALFLEAARYENGGPVYRNLKPEDLLPIAPSAVRGAASAEDKLSIAGAVSLWKLEAVVPLLVPFLKEDDQYLWQTVPACLRLKEKAWAVTALEPILTDPRAETRCKALRLLKEIKVRECLAPGLRAVKDASPDVRREAFGLLADLGFPEAGPELMPLLDDPKSRIHAAYTLASLGHQAAVPRLLAFLAAPEANVRQAAVSGLVALRAPGLAPRILPLLQDSDVWVRWDAMIAAAKLLEKEAVPHLLPFLDSDEELLREKSLWILADLEARDAVPRIVLRLKDKAAAVRHAALRALVSLEAKDQGKNLLPLLDDPEESIRYEVMGVLAELGVREAIPPFIKRLEAKEDPVRERAIECLRRLNAIEAIPKVIPLLKDKGENISAVAREFLIQLRAKGVLPLVLPLLEDPLPENRRQILSILEDHPTPDLIPSLVPLLGSTHGDVRDSARQILSGLEDRKIVPDVVKLLAHERPQVRADAVRLLTDLRAVEAYDSILTLIDDPTLDVRQVLIETLDPYEVPHLFPLLRASLRSPEAVLRMAAAEAVRDRNFKPLGQDLLPLFKDPDLSVREAAVDAVYRLQMEGLVPYALEALKDGSRDIRWRAASIVSQQGGPEHASHFLPWLDSEEVQDRAQAIWILGNWQAAGPAERIIAQIQAEDRQVRQAVYFYAGALGRREAIPELLKAARNDMDYGAAMLALGALRAAEAVPVLLEILEVGTPDVQRMCLMTLGSIGAKESVAPLLKLLDDKELAEAAARALGQMGAREALPIVLARPELHSALSGFKPDDLLPMLEEPRHRVAVVRAIQVSLPEPAEARIAALLSDKDGDVRSAALETLMNCRATRSREAIEKRLRDDLPSVRTRALWMLNFSGHYAPIRSLVRDPDPAVRAAALAALGSDWKPEDAALLTGLLKEGTCAAAEGLGLLEARGSGPALLDHLKGHRCKEIVQALAELDVREAVPLLEEHAGDEQTAEWLLEALVRLGSEKGVPRWIDSQNRHFPLNVLRSPEEWKRLRACRLKAGDLPKEPKDLRPVLEAVARHSGLKLEVSPAAWLEYSETVWEVPARGQPALQILEALDSYSLACILDSGTIRILNPPEAAAFWRRWWRERSKR